MKSFSKLIAVCLIFMSQCLVAQNNGVRIVIEKQEPTENPVAIYQLDEVTILEGENPAFRIIDSVLLHRRENDPDRLGSYSYSIYDKMVFTLDSLDLARAKKKSAPDGAVHAFDSILRESDLMVMETYSEVIFKAPDRKRQTVKAVKVAGMRDPVFMYMAEHFQSVNFYDETVTIAGTKYLNPISKASKRYYGFYLESVTPHENDTLFAIAFWPLENSNLDGLQGTIIVNSDGWAVQQVKAAPAEQGGIYTVDFQQLYEKFEGQWFPRQFNVNLMFPSIKLAMEDVAVPMVAIGKSYISDIQINPPLDAKLFSDIVMDIDPDAYTRDDDYWMLHRLDSLNDRTMATYLFLDSITMGTNIFDVALGMTSRLVEDAALPIGPLDLEIGDMLRYSFMRGLYLGVTLSTNDRFSRHFRLKGFGGYWTRVGEFDYGAEGKWLINRRHETELGMRYAHKSIAMGEFGGFSEGENMLSETQYKYTFYENVLVKGDFTEGFFNTRFAQHFKAFLTFGVYDKNYRTQYFIQPSDTMPMTRFSNAEVKLRFAYKERFLSTPRGIQSLGADYPIVWLSYMHSFKGLFGSQYEFDRFKLQIEKDFRSLRFGTTSVLLQMGYATSACPVMETFTPIGSYEPFGLYSQGCFATMRENEFFSDRFVALYLSHNFGGTLWRPRSAWFQPELTLATHLGWGDLRRADGMMGMNFKTLEKGYFESGIVVDGLLSLPLMKVGLGAFYRYGPYALGNFKEDIALKWSVVFSF